MYKQNKCTNKINVQTNKCTNKINVQYKINVQTK